MKKIIKITIILFLVTTVLNILLNYIINEQIISRILFGMDYNTYLTNYYSGQLGLIKLISEDKMPYEWVFSLSKYILILFCIIVEFLTIKKLKAKYTITKRELITIISIFSILSVYDSILYIVMFHMVPPLNFFVLPIIFIIFTFIFIYKMLYKQSKYK